MNRPLRVLFITNLYPPHHLGGYEIACKDIVEGLRRKGHIVRVLTSTYGIDEQIHDGFVSRLLDIKLKLNAPQSLLEKSKILFFNSRNYQITKYCLEDFKPDIASFWSINGISASTIYAAERAGVPKVFHLFDRSLSNLRKIRNKGILNLILFNRLGIDNLVSSSSELKRDYIERGFQDHNITVIPHGVNLDKYPFREKNPNGILKLLFVGQLWEGKGLSILLTAVSKLKKKRVPLKLFIVGSGEKQYTDYLFDLCNSLSIRDVVEFLGKIERSNLVKLYQESHLLLFPSIWKEPFGIVLLEAMATGTPVIASRKGGPLDIIEDGKTGYFFNPNNDEDLVNKVLSLERNRMMIGQFGLNARKRMENEFDLSNVVFNINKYYNKILGSKHQ